MQLQNTTPQADELSPVARQVLEIDLANAYTQLVVSGQGNPRAKQILEGATGDLMLSGQVRSRQDANAMLSGLWLWHDWLDESHKLAQSIDTPTGSFWHAIMHRREGDFANSKYWYARCRDHLVLKTMLAHARPLIDPQPADMMLLKLTSPGWNPEVFVDLVAEAASQPPDHPRHRLAVSLQQLEWRLLFDHCTRAAAGK